MTHDPTALTKTETNIQAMTHAERNGVFMIQYIQIKSGEDPDPDHIALRTWRGMSPERVARTYATYTNLTRFFERITKLKRVNHNKPKGKTVCRDKRQKNEEMPDDLDALVVEDSTTTHTLGLGA
jgi:hypothetical protein